MFYILLGLIFLFKTVGEIDTFFITALQILLFASTDRKPGNRKVKAINISYNIFSAVCIIFLFASNIYDYFSFRFEEGHTTARINAVLDSMKAFGTTECVSEICNTETGYNLIRIFGFFGYVTGIIIFAILTAFIASICIRSYKNKGKLQPADITAVTILILRYISSLLINCGILFGRIDVKIPVLSDGAVGYLLIGILLGAILSEADSKRNKIISENPQEAQNAEQGL